MHRYYFDSDPTGFTEVVEFPFAGILTTEGVEVFFSFASCFAHSSQPRLAAVLRKIPKNETIAAIIVQNADRFADNAARPDSLDDSCNVSASRFNSSASGVIPIYVITLPQ